MMNIAVILAGLKKTNADAVLQRMESMISQLPQNTQYCIYQTGCEECLEEIQGWAATLPADESLSGEETVPDLILACGTPEGKYTGMKLAAAKGIPCHTEAVSFTECYGELMAVRKVYSTHLEGLYPAAGSVTIAATTGEKKEFAPADRGERENGAPVHPLKLLVGNLIQMDERQAQLLHEMPVEKTEDLAGARLVLLGGKGLGKKENFQRLEALAEKLGASCGCTRPVAMAGWTSYDKVVGLSGSILSADVCIAFGVSGAGPLMTGAGGAARLVAVNNDPKAPIFHYAHDGVVADCMEILEAMEQLADGAPASAAE